MDDDLGDLDDIMGDDYAHGYDDAEGDPNIKPKPSTPPTEDVHHRSESTLGVIFPAQKQFLTDLEVQAMPLLMATPGNPNAFAEFSTAKGGQSVKVPGDPKTETSVQFKNLMPGMPYSFRLIATNPAGRTVGKQSKPILTTPAPPAAPVFLHSRGSSIFIRFPENSRGGKQIVNKLTIGVAKAGPPDPFDPANKPGAMSDSSANAATLKQARIQRLAPGTLYVFRLTVENASGKAVGAISAPMLTCPAPPSRLREDPKARTSSSIKLRFARHGQHLTHLTVQYALLQGGAKMTFDQLMKKGGKNKPIPNPQTIQEFAVDGLEGNKKYVFRLACKNKSGVSIGTVLGPIQTVEHAPDMLDKSGWMTIVPKMDGKKTLGRRLSSRSKEKGKKYWFVIDGRLLEWYDKIDGEEVGFLHLSKLKRITYVPDADGQARQFSLILKSGEKTTLECSSTDPNLSTHDYTMSWMSSIQKALSGMQKTNEEFKKQKETEAGKNKGRRASIQAAADDELDDDDDDAAQVMPDDFGGDEEGEDGGVGGDFDEDGFGDDDDTFGADEGGGFGGFSDDEEGADDGGFGGAGDDFRQAEDEDEADAETFGDFENFAEDDGAFGDGSEDEGGDDDDFGGDGF